MGETYYQILGRHRADPLPERKPSWLKVKAPGSGTYRRLRHLMGGRTVGFQSTMWMSHRAAGMEMGFRHVEGGTLVRSSYHAWEQVQAAGIS